VKHALSLLLAVAGTLPAEPPQGTPWPRHTIDNTSRGADGVRLTDVNGDGRLDIATGWEEGGVIRVYVNPGPKKSRQAWPMVTVGKVKSAEDAVLVDLDGDGRTDVVSCCEGRTRTVFVHWAPRDADDYLKASSWRTMSIEATAGKQSWMYAMPLQIDGKQGVDLIVGSKGKNASVGWLESPSDPRDTKAWRYHRLYDAGWIMSLEPLDVDHDGDVDVVVSDRKGRNRGVLWLENPGAKKSAAGAIWKRHRIGAAGKEVMFLAIADLNGDKRQDIVCSTRAGQIYFFAQREGMQFSTVKINNPLGIRNGKAVAVGDIDLDGRPDLVHDTNKGKSSLQTPALTWMRFSQSPAEQDWLAFDVSGPAGVKFDRIELLDLDGDGDLDILTCEERDNLGVFWYENPTRRASRR